MGSAIDASAASSSALLELLIPNSRAKSIKEANEPIKGLYLGISRISNLSSSIPNGGGLVKCC